MNVWMITTGSSDVQLTTHEKWNRLCDQAREQQDINKKLNFPKQIELTKSVVKPKGSNSAITRFLAPARAMGIVYGNAITEKAEYYNDLDFPLLNNFSTLLEEKKIVFDRIIVLVTDQANLFPSSSEKNQIYCPYWQDTCTLETILKQYFQQFSHKVEGIEPEFLILQPAPKKTDDARSKIPGLDDWNNVLKLVQKKFANLTDIPENATVYVSHQASTPAISSAVQFVSLARFGERVKFLVSNEYENKPLDPIESSEYLKGIKFQEAKALLNRYDYEGVKDLLSPYWSQPLTPLEQKISELLEMAIQWNRSEFKDFGDLAKDKIEKAKERINQPWAWWIGYESAYLAVVRLEQENTVEALFHSFRAAEGLICKWAEWRYEKHINYKKDKETDLESPLINRSITTELPDYLKNKFNNKNESRNQESVGLYSFNLYELLRQSRKCEKDTRIDVVWKIAAKWRNNYFHQLLGLQEQEVFEAWDTNNRTDWKKKVLGCLNFVSGQDAFTSLEEASLMFQVHEKLKDAITLFNQTDITA